MDRVDLTLHQEPGSQAWHEARGLSPVYHPDDLIAGTVHLAEVLGEPSDQVATEAKTSTKSTAAVKKSSRKESQKQASAVDSPSMRDAGAQEG